MISDTSKVLTPEMDLQLFVHFSLIIIALRRFSSQLHMYFYPQSLEVKLSACGLYCVYMQLIISNNLSFKFLWMKYLFVAIEK